MLQQIKVTKLKPKKVKVKPVKARAKQVVRLVKPAFRYRNQNGSVQTNIQGIRYVENLGEGYKYNCPHHFKPGTKHTAAIDWFQLSAQLTDTIDQSLIGTTFNYGAWQFYNEDKGTRDYVHSYTIKNGNKAYFKIQLSPRNSKEFRTCLIRVENWLFYDLKGWKTIRDFIYSATSKINHISRLDIALDGLNHTYDLMNDWMTDTNLDYGVKLIGKSTVRPYQVNRITKRPEGYKIGTGDKIISIYNKTKDIPRTSKHYIKEYWYQNGLDINKTNYRFEMRLYSGYLKGLKVEDQFITPEFVLDNADKYAFQIGLVRLATIGIFEWVYMDNKNVTRCSRVDLFPTGILDMARVRAAPPIGSPYKAKMTIHNMYLQVCSKIIGKEEGIAVIKENLNQFQLYDWYKIAVQKYCKMYVAFDGSLQSDLFNLMDKPKPPNWDLQDRYRAIVMMRNARNAKINFNERASALTKEELLRRI